MAKTQDNIGLVYGEQEEYEKFISRQRSRSRSKSRAKLHPDVAACYYNMSQYRECVLASGPSREGALSNFIKTARRRLLTCINHSRSRSCKGQQHVDVVPAYKAVALCDWGLLGNHWGVETRPSSIGDAHTPSGETTKGTHISLHMMTQDMLLHALLSHHVVRIPEKEPVTCKFFHTIS